MRLTVILLLSIFFFQGVYAQQKGEVLVRELVSTVFCACGCDRMLISECNCGKADEMEEFISRRVKAGGSKENILTELTNRYGNQVVPISPEKGFGLGAWITSILAFLAGSSVVILALRTWVRNKREKAGRYYPEDIKKYQKRIEKELRDYEL